MPNHQCAVPPPKKMRLWAHRDTMEDAESRFLVVKKEEAPEPKGSWVELMIKEP